MGPELRALLNLKMLPQGLLTYKNKPHYWETLLGMSASALCGIVQKPMITRPFKSIRLSLDQRCIYCGRSGIQMSDEHVVPEALLGGVVIETVCPDCNNGVLSQLDDELASNSPLACLASRQKLNAEFTDAWSIDPQTGFLFEGRHDLSTNSFRLFPQLIIADEKLLFAGDGDDILRYGHRVFQQRLTHHILSVFNSGPTVMKKRLRREQVRPLWPERARFPPRVVFNHSFNNLNGKSKLYLKFLSNDGKLNALNQITKLSRQHSFQRVQLDERIRLHPVQLLYRPEITGRALLKIGINLLNWLGINPPVDFHSSNRAIQLVMGSVRDEDLITRTCRLIPYSAVSDMQCPGDSHMFWVCHEGNRWIIQAAFFGGKAAARIEIPGRSYESWRWTEIVAPLKKKTWSKSHHTIVPPLKPPPQWHELKDLVQLSSIENTTQLAVRERGKWIAAKN